MSWELMKASCSLTSVGCFVLHVPLTLVALHKERVQVVCWGKGLFGFASLFPAGPDPVFHVDAALESRSAGSAYRIPELNF
jgi:hypothetical protein